MRPEFEQPTTSTTETAQQYEPADEDLAEVEIGQETSTTARKKQSQRGRTEAAPDIPTTPVQGATVTSTGLTI